LVAGALKARSPSAIIFTSRFNASYSSFGWRRTPILELGLPLLAILDEAEFVALLAHELAHQVNGDATKSVFVGSALNTLGRWYRALAPGRLVLHGQGFLSLAAVGSRVVMRMLAAIIRMHAAILSHFLWRDAQRAEYLADHLAAKLAGTQAMLSLLDKLQLEGLLSGAIGRAARNPERADLFLDLREQVLVIPNREWRRIRRIGHLETPQLDATHPPTGYRITLLEAHPLPEQPSLLGGALWQQFRQELANAQRQMQPPFVAMADSGIAAIMMQPSLAPARPPSTQTRQPRRAFSR
jgi:heat shock protein HtpX